MVINTKGEKKVIEIPIISIRPCKNQARVYFKRDEMQELAISIRENGILQPLTVRRVSKNEYELIAGERRLRAASMCGMKSCLLYTSPSPRDVEESRMPSSA